MAIREFSAGGIIIKKFKDDLKVLLIKDGYGRWTWPKGNMEKGESAQETAQREINEEVGLKDIKIIDRIDLIKYFYRLKDELIFKTVSLFLFEASGSERVTPLKSEIKEAKWFILEEALRIVEYKGSNEILKKAIDRYRRYLDDEQKEEDTAC